MDKFKLSRFKFINKHKQILFFSTMLIAFIILFNIGIPHSVLASSVETEKPGIAEKTFAAMVRGFAWFLDNLFFQNAKLTLDSIIYNTGNKGYGLTLMQDTDLSKFIIQFYLVIQYLAALFFIPMGLWIALDFKKSKENPQHIVVLKDRLVKWVITFFLITGVPQILDLMFTLNGLMVEVFKAVGTNFLMQKATSNSMIQAGQDGFLLNAFKEAASKSQTFGDAVIYLMSVFLNVWIVFYYFIRDIVICYLFIIFPFIAIFLPFKKGVVTSWFSEVFSNVITQTIHAFFFTLVIAGAVYLPHDPHNEMFTMTAFASIIPGTAILKRLFGLEGSVGLSSSLAGFGAMAGAMQIAKNLTTKAAKGASGIKEGIGDLIDTGSESKSNKKGLSASNTSVTSQPLPNINSTLQNNKGEQDIANKKREAWRKIHKGAGTIAGGVSLGSLNAIGGSVFGARGATTLSDIGTSIGGGMGGFAGAGVGLAHSAVDYEMEKNNAIYGNEELSEQEAMDQYTGLTSPILQNTEFKSNEQKAILGQKRLQALGFNKLANYKYAKTAPSRKSSEEIKGLKNASLYQDKDQSVLYNQKEDGTREILSTWGGDASLGDKRVQGMVSFNDGKLEISNDRLGQLSSIAEGIADNTDVTKIAGYGDMVSSEYDKQMKSEEKGWKNQANSYAENELKYDPQYLEKQDALNRYSEDTKSMYEMDKYQQLVGGGFSESIARSQSKEYAKNAIKTDSGYLNLQKESEGYYNSNFEKLSDSKFNELKTTNSAGVENVARKTVEGNLRKDIARKELGSLQKAELSKLEGLRGSSGLNNLVLESGLHDFNDKIATQKDMETNGQMTDRDMHISYNSRGQDVQSALDETEQTRLRYENIQREKAMLEQYISKVDNFR